MEKILLTGSNGFIGYYLTEQMLKKGYSVMATSKGENRREHPGQKVDYTSLDFTDPEAINQTFKKYNPSIVIHCGALSKPDDCELNKPFAYQVNVKGTIDLLSAAKRHACFFIFLSTDFVFDGQSGMYQEEDETSPVNYYGLTKVLAEEKVRNYAFNWSIARTVLVYGKTLGGRPNLITSTAIALKRGDPLKIFNDQVRTPTYVEDLASGILSIIEKKARGIFHLSGEDILTPFQMAVSVARYLQLDESLIKPVKEGDFLQPAQRPLKTGFNISKAKEMLGYTCLSFADGLKNSLEI
ncbi:MAG: SDR family oxidoreductase [Flavisolibacter sp.]